MTGARHYVSWSQDIQATLKRFRSDKHLPGILREAKRQGIDWSITGFYEGGPRAGVPAASLHVACPHCMGVHGID